MSLRALDRLGEAEEAMQRGRETDERHGHVSFLPLYHYETASLLFLSGQWDDAVAQAEAGIALAGDVGLGLISSWPYGLLAVIAAHRNDLGAAQTWIATVDRELARPSDRLMTAQALLDEAGGETARALATLTQAWDRVGRRGAREVAPQLLRLALAAGDRERAEAVAASVEEAAALASVPSLDGAALRCRGLIEADVALLLRAVDRYREGPRVFERATACEDAAVALGRAGRTDEATALFGEALDVYEQLGAEWDTARALASMRELGLRRKRRGARKRPEHGWESLTPSELEVVRLAADGLTNPQIGQRLFISRRTVQTHLAHAFRKLDISSRVELAAEAARRSGG